MMLIKRIKIPAIASPFTNFDAPSIRALTSEIRPAPLVTTIKLMIIRIRNTTKPTA
ncbi:Uncharacterised protein [Vibrio cholerae]|nr:Uncharacterised protein [Vibrio cholerae]